MWWADSKPQWAQKYHSWHRNLCTGGRFSESFIHSEFSVRMFQLHVHLWCFYLLLIGLMSSIKLCIINPVHLQRPTHFCTQTHPDSSFMLLIIFPSVKKSEIHQTELLKIQTFLFLFPELFPPGGSVRLLLAKTNVLWRFLWLKQEQIPK